MSSFAEKAGREIMGKHSKAPRTHSSLDNGILRQGKFLGNTAPVHNSPSGT